jgi:hypothetical protein
MRAVDRISLSEPPRQTRWEVVGGERTELRDAAGSVLAWTKAEGRSAVLHSADGRLLTQTLPLMRVSRGDLVSMATNGMFGGDTPVATSGSAGLGQAAALRIKDVSTSVSFAEVGGERALIQLFPPGPINSRMVARKLPAAEVARMRERGPLSFAPMAGELVDAAGTVLVRTHGPAESESWSIDVADNFLPATWLFSILLACRRAST